MKAGRKEQRRLPERRLRIKRAKPMPGDDVDNDDPDTLPLGIMRTAMNVNDGWRNCHRPACKRGRACRGRQVECSSELPRRQPRGNAEKRQRDGARSMAILQRMLRERLALVQEREASAHNDDASSSHARQQTHRRRKQRKRKQHK